MGAGEEDVIADNLTSAQALLAGQNRVLELVAGDAPLGEILATITQLIESQGSGLLCSVLLLEDDRLHHGAAPSLPEAYIRAIDGVVIGPSVGSCGTAAFTGKSVVVTDIATDPLWAGYKQLALVHGLRACWSTPILSSRGEVLGTFAVYYSRPSAPRSSDLRLIEIATHITRIAIERRRTDQALKAQAQLLRDLDRRKDEFLALLAHELRNPLAPILAAVELMRLRGDDPVKVERYRTTIERQARQLSRLVDDLLDVSRIMRGKIELVKERTTVAALIARAAETAAPLIEQRRHQLSILLPREPLEIEADPVRLTQALSNLLNNAAKYTDPGGQITVSAALERGEIVIRVKDSGKGIAPEMLPRIFDLFMQADVSLGRSMGGLGVGLTLARTLIEMHGGRIDAHSEGIDRGSEIVVHLPPGSAPDHRGSPSSQPPVSRQGAARVLVVDDNVDAAEGLAELLTVEGNEVSIAHDGDQALSRVREWAPNVVFLDIGLPGIDGYEVARRLRLEHPSRELRLIALSGYAQEADIRRGEAAGFDAHLVKPADLQQIRAALKG
jgi:signal transduction histidine kinase/CheY-like chemotaxis protein